MDSDTASQFLIQARHWARDSALNSNRAQHVAVTRSPIADAAAIEQHSHSAAVDISPLLYEALQSESERARAAETRADTVAAHSKRLEEQLALVKAAAAEFDTHANAAVVSLEGRVERLQLEAAVAAERAHDAEELLQLLRSANDALKSQLDDSQNRTQSAESELAALRAAAALKKALPLQHVDCAVGDCETDAVTSSAQTDAPRVAHASTSTASISMMMQDACIGSDDTSSSAKHVGTQVEIAASLHSNSIKHSGPMTETEPSAHGPASARQQHRANSTASSQRALEPVPTAPDITSASSAANEAPPTTLVAAAVTSPAAAAAAAPAPVLHHQPDSAAAMPSQLSIALYEIASLRAQQSLLLGALDTVRSERGLLPSDSVRSERGLLPSDSVRSESRPLDSASEAVRSRTERSESGLLGGGAASLLEPDYQRRTATAELEHGPHHHDERHESVRRHSTADTAAAVTGTPWFSTEHYHPRRLESPSAQPAMSSGGSSSSSSSGTLGSNTSPLALYATLQQQPVPLSPSLQQQQQQQQQQQPASRSPAAPAPHSPAARSPPVPLLWPSAAHMHDPDDACAVEHRGPPLLQPGSRPRSDRRERAKSLTRAAVAAGVGGPLLVVVTAASTGDTREAAAQQLRGHTSPFRRDYFGPSGGNKYRRSSVTSSLWQQPPDNAASSWQPRKDAASSRSLREQRQQQMQQQQGQIEPDAAIAATRRSSLSISTQQQRRGRSLPPKRGVIIRGGDGLDVSSSLTRGITSAVADVRRDEGGELHDVKLEQHGRGTATGDMLTLSGRRGDSRSAHESNTFSLSSSSSSRPPSANINNKNTIASAGTAVRGQTAPSSSSSASSSLLLRRRRPSASSSGVHSVDNRTNAALQTVLALASEDLAHAKIAAARLTQQRPVDSASVATAVSAAAQFAGVAVTAAAASRRRTAAEAVRDTDQAYAHHDFNDGRPPHAATATAATATTPIHFPAPSFADELGAPKVGDHSNALHSSNSSCSSSHIVADEAPLVGDPVPGMRSLLQHLRAIQADAGEHPGLDAPGLCACFAALDVGRAAVGAGEDGLAAAAAPAASGRIDADAFCAALELYEPRLSLDSIVGLVWEMHLQDAQTIDYADFVAALDMLEQQ